MVVNMEIIKSSKDWKEEPLYPKICKIIDTPHYTSPKSKYGSIPIITTSQCSSKGIDYTTADSTTYKEYERRKSFIDPDIGELLFTREAPAGIAVLVDKKKIVVGQRIVLLKPNKKKINNYFLNSFLNSYSTKKQLDKLKIQTTVERINIEEIKKILIPIPKLPEQDKIAQVLFDFDELIIHQTKLIEKKKNIKKGTMQELLTGKRRLPGFDDEWEETILGKVGDIINGGTPSTSVKQYWNGSILWCTPTDITSTKGKYISDTKRKITKDGYDNSSTSLLPPGTLLLCSRATIGDVKIASKEITTNQGFKAITCFKNFDNEFIYYKLLTMKNKLIEKSVATTFLEISKKDTYNTKIFIPTSKEEQTAIARILSDMDSEINKLERERDKCLMIKDGMKQKLLSGEIRLK